MRIAPCLVCDFVRTLYRDGTCSAPCGSRARGRQEGAAVMAGVIAMGYWARATAAEWAYAQGRDECVHMERSYGGGWCMECGAAIPTGTGL